VFYLLNTPNHEEGGQEVSKSGQWDFRVQQATEGQLHHGVTKTAQPASHGEGELGEDVSPADSADRRHREKRDENPLAA